MSHKEPGESQCEKVSTNQKNFTFSEKGGKFTSDFVYVSFFSHTGCPL
jgi:glycyl-tRNA synthetase beta subunit